MTQGHFASAPLFEIVLMSFSQARLQPTCFLALGLWRLLLSSLELFVKLINMEKKGCKHHRNLEFDGVRACCDSRFLALFTSDFCNEAFGDTSKDPLDITESRLDQ